MNTQDNISLQFYKDLTVINNDQVADDKSSKSPSDSGTRNNQKNTISFGNKNKSSKSFSYQNDRKMELSKNRKKWLIIISFLALAALAITFIILYATKATDKNDIVQTITTTVLPTTITTELPPNIDDIRLSSKIIPINYKLEIMPNFDENSFSGINKIKINIIEDMPNIRLHSQDLNIDNNDFILENSSNISIKINKIDNKKFQTITFIPSESNLFIKGIYLLTLKFNGIFKSGSFTGFYKSNYKTKSGEIKELVTTKFEPTYARQAFPCFDETNFKATFDISIIHPDRMTALSNEKILSSIPTLTKIGWNRTVFATTPQMSTYTVAYVVSEFVYTETKTSRGIPVRVYSRPDEIQKTSYATEAAANILDYYEDYTSIPYKLSKLDLIGIPGFISGAMENWGLVTYKENYILYDPNESSIFNQRQIAAVISHELAHMWWGNLVTLNWWSELYLNEGYASMIEYKGQNHLNKSWSILDSYLTSDLHGALKADMLKSAHPLNSPNVLTPDQATATFDTISYSKGASILWMLESFVGEDNFRDSQRNYLKEYQFKTANSSIMLSFFDKIISEKTQYKYAYDFMNSWIDKAGFPIIFVSRSKESNGKTKITLNQTPYQANSDIIWNIPIKYSTPNGDYEYLLTKKIETFEIELKNTEWLKLNKDSNGYFIVQYEDNDWDLLIAQLQQNPNIFSVKDRANLIFDAYQLTELKISNKNIIKDNEANSSLMSYERFFRLLDFLKNENNQLPWSVANTALNSLRSRLNSIGSLSSSQFNTYIIDLIKYIYDKSVDFDEKLGQKNYLDTSLQNILISLACSSEYEACLDETDRIFKNFINSRNSIPPNIRSDVYRFGIQSSKNVKDFEILWNLYRAELDAAEKARLIAALTSTKNSGLLNQLIKYSEDPLLVDNENFFSFQQNIATASQLGRGLVWDYIQNNWQKLIDRFGLNDRRLGTYVRVVCQDFSTENRLNEMNRFFTKYPNAGAGEANRLIAIESVQKNIIWAKNNEKLISNELIKRDQLTSPWLNWRLNEFVRPSHYDVTLKIDIDNRKFNGKVIIDYNVLSPTSYLILHSRELVITSSKVFSSSGLIVSNDTGSMFYPDKYFFVIPMKQLLGIDNYRAELEFNGQLKQELTGLYLSSYIKSGTNQERVYLATTQFEAGYARKAFPCFDEPSFKAQFTIQIIADKKFTAVSNMPMLKMQNIDDQWRQTFFQKTVPMSTYLVAFVVSDFTAVQSQTDTMFRCLTFNPDINTERCKYANEIGPKILNAYSKYFGNAYQLPKLDQVAVPDFSLGAMENWGLVTYRDAYLLYDPEESPASTQMSVAYIISHELAHMWFGNQVTIKWWNELWLNEGFAEFMEYKGVESVHPEWQYSNYFAITELSRVFEVDSSSNSRPILTVIRDDNDMQMIFDGVTYAKGASVIRMLEATIGEEKFQQAIQNYMKKFAYKNTQTTDLWNTFSDVVDEKLDISKMMSNWISREGFPVINIQFTQDGKIQVSQKRFLKDGKTPTTNTVWFIPLTYRALSSDLTSISTKRLNFNTEVATFSLENYHPDFIYKFNIDQKGVYIVNYPVDVWNRIANELKRPESYLWKQLSILDRNSLISDAYYLARANMLPYSVAMNLAEFLKYEESFVVWQTASDLIGYVEEFAVQQDGGIAFKKWLDSLVQIQYKRLTWEPKTGENLNDKRLRALITNLACHASNDDCLKIANEKFQEFLINFSKISALKDKNLKNNLLYKPDPNTLAVFLNHAMRQVNDNSNLNDYNKLLELYQKSTDTSEKNRYLRALTSVRNTNKLKELLEKSTNREFIRKQDFFNFLSFMASNPVALEMTWEFYRDKYEEFQNDFTIEEPNLGRAIYRFSAYFTTEERKEEILKLYSDFPKAGAGELYRKQAIELVDANIKWISQYYQSVSQIVTEKCQENDCPWKNYRLNPNVIPKNYKIFLQVHNDEHWFKGNVTIDVTLTKSQSYIVLHAASKLKTTDIQIYSSNNKAINHAKANQFRYEPFQLLVLPLSSEINAGNYIIVIDFSGDNRAYPLSGLYNGTYVNDSGKTINISSTQFQATHAREAFPCFDEPTYKQPIQMTIQHQKEMKTVLTNMVQDGDTKIVDNIWLKTEFKPTNVPLPTYLGAILVSDFICKEVLVSDIGITDTIPLQTCASSVNHINTFDYSLQITPGILKSYVESFQQKYQMPKLDQVAIPQFDAGAMENWGLVKYREAYLLWHEDRNTAAEQRGVASVIAHELAHMWFGNSLTCKYWDELWLNEAFASYMEYGAVSYVHPKWNYFDFIMTEDRISGMTNDYDSTVHALIRKPILKPADRLYNSRIIYAKGATVLHMFNRVLGTDQFQNALRQYQKDNKNNVVVHDDLYAALKANWKYANYDAIKFFDSWANQSGYPYVNITCEIGKNCYYSQARFCDNPNDKTLYSLPYSYYVKIGRNNKLDGTGIEFYDESSGELTHKANEFIKINPDFQGYFLVNYPLDHWKWLADQMVKNENDFVTKQLSVNDRSELLYSAYQLSNKGLADKSILMPFFNYLKHEKHIVPFQVYQWIKRTDGNLVEISEYRESIMAFERRIADAHYNDDMWNLKGKQNPEISFNRQILEMACRSEHVKCLNYVKASFDKFRISPDETMPDLKELIAYYGMQTTENGNEAIHDFIELFNNSKKTDPWRNVYRNAPAATNDWKIAEYYLKLSNDESIYTKNDYYQILTKMITNYYLKEDITNWIFDNIGMLKRKFSEATCKNIISSISNTILDTNGKNIIENLLKKFKYSFDMSTIDKNIKWMSNNGKLIGEWYNSNGCGTNDLPTLCPWADMRIDGKAIDPQRYDIDIRVNVTSTIYDGNVSIELEIKDQLLYLPVHAANQLDVTFISLTNNAKKSVVENIRTFRYKPEMRFVLAFTDYLPIGNYTLQFAFNSSLLNNGLSGLYRSTYNDNGIDVPLASTQMEFYDARKMFPCFDEPAFKSIFRISITHEKKMSKTLANAPLNRIENIDDKWIKSIYEDTPKMTTYLVAILVSDYVCDEKISNSGYTFNVCAPRIHKNKLTYALENSILALETLEKLLDFKYPMKKVDLVAIPDFYYGAMENWGLITFRESALLYSEDDTTIDTKIRIASIIAHEIAHFWFGNLVTCEWWDALFLNEAFATLMQYPVVSVTESSWDMNDMFLIYDFDRAIAADSVETTHALLRTPIDKTTMIDRFDSSIIYSKGASVFRMVQFMMGETEFFSALSEYMKLMKYENARPEDLFSTFDNHYKSWSEDKSNMTIFLKEWIQNTGFPYIEVSQVAGTKTFAVKQRRFLYRETNVSDVKTVWKIPISYYTDSVSNKQKFNIKILEQENENMILNDISGDDLPKLNIGHTGFYLVNYSDDLWKKFINALVNNFENSKLFVPDRAGLLFDAFTLAKGNKLKYATPLKLSEYLKHETHITPLTLAIRAFDGIRKNIDLGSKYGKEFKEFVITQFEPIYKSLGWNEIIRKDDIEKSLRGKILDFVCDYGYQDCLDKAAEFYKKWKNGVKLSANLLPVVLKYGLQSDINGQEWQYVWGLYQNEQSATLKSIYMNGLVGSPNQENIRLLLNSALKAQGIRSQDSISTMLSVARSLNPTILETVWQFIQKNFDDFFAQESSLKPTDVSRLLVQLSTNYFFTDTRRAELSTFLSSKISLLSQSQYQASLDAIDTNIEWLNTRMIEIESFLLCRKDLCSFTNFRLPIQVQPQEYFLNLNIDLDNEIFSGSVTIEVDTKAAQGFEYLHLHASKSLNVTDVKFYKDNNVLIPTEKPFRYESMEFLVVPLKESLNTDNVKMIYTFNSKLADDMFGLYKSSYVDTNKKNVKLAATQFQDIHARRVFPCFDEPTFRAIYTVTIEHDKNLHVHSNMEIDKTQSRAGFTRFLPTPKMVSYLLAFVVSDFKCGEGVRAPDGVKIQICATPTEQDSIQYGMNITGNLITAMDKKYNYNYGKHMKKMDLFAIPDFSAGAMENWGLLTFRETRLLWNKENADAANKMAVASVVAHEITHMWFGNLVTCKFWSDLWINEAFASYMEYFSVDIIEPDWDYWQLFFITDYISGMRSDASSTSHPLVRNVQKPSDISYISTIIYQKGASILRMFEQTFTTNDFFKALQEYLVKNELTSVESQVLLDELGTISVEGLKTPEFLNSWTKQAGFPYLNLTRNKNSYSITQKRFLSNGDEDKSGTKWIVPLTYYLDYSKSKDYKTIFFDQHSGTITLDDQIGKTLPIKFNVNSEGFYIVNYPIEEWKDWINLLKQKHTDDQNAKLKLTSQDMAHLLFDASLLSGAGYLSYDISLGLTQSLAVHEDFSLWSTGSSILSGLWPYFRASANGNDVDNLYEKVFTDYAQSIVKNIYNTYGLQSKGLDDDNYLQKQRLQQTVSSFACAYRLSRCLLEAQIEFAKWRDNADYKLSPNVRTTVWRYGIQASVNPKSDWDYLWNRYMDENRVAIKLDYLQALASSQDRDTLKLLLELALDSDNVRRQDYLSLWAYITRTPIGHEVAWQFFKENVDTIRAKRLTSSQIGTLAGYFANYNTKIEQSNELEQFFLQNSQTGISSVSFERAKQTMKSNQVWITSYRSQVVDWFKNSSKSTNASL